MDDERERAEEELEAALAARDFELARKIGALAKIPDLGWCSIPHCPACRRIGGYCGN